MAEVIDDMTIEDMKHDIAKMVARFEVALIRLRALRDKDGLTKQQLVDGMKNVVADIEGIA